MILAAVPAVSFAQDGDLEPFADDDAEFENAVEDYVEQGTVEIGGSIGGSFNDNVTTFTASPTVGFFFVDRFELSASLLMTYTRIEDDELNMDASEMSTAFILEPSYHHPINDTVLLVGGLGVGPGFDGDFFDFEVIPRVGVNIMTGRSSLITPSIRVPIKIGEGHGMNEDVGVDTGVLVDVGVTATW